ncbi:hypothetical protein KSP39_PZI004017 [Platanthera zijinensis]|uniref:Uncharacterized protein n=1 Tax=Platanthera zijinensis TaxID=2320716 RepID=A0AAP0GCR2_9ASPA
MRSVVTALTDRNTATTPRREPSSPPSPPRPCAIASPPQHHQDQTELPVRLIAKGPSQTRSASHRLCNNNMRPPSRGDRPTHSPQVHSQGTKPSAKLDRERTRSIRLANTATIRITPSPQLSTKLTAAVHCGQGSSPRAEADISPENILQTCSHPIGQHLPTLADLEAFCALQSDIPGLSQPWTWFRTNQVHTTGHQGQSALTGGYWYQSAKLGELQYYSALTGESCGYHQPHHKILCRAPVQSAPCRTPQIEELSAWLPSGNILLT